MGANVKQPRLLEGGIHTDHRGQISFVNGMVFADIVRFYIISNSEQQPLRAWQGHKIDNKYFYCVQGMIRVHFVRVDDWASPSKDLAVESVLLSATESKVLHLPEGYANAIESLEVGSKLISFSTLPLDRTKEDDVRFPVELWPLDSARGDKGA
jgi:dTDP-4-dehydrorhamnose 3,5-epimerase-like enzyme